VSCEQFFHTLAVLQNSLAKLIVAVLASLGVDAEYVENAFGFWGKVLAPHRAVAQIRVTDHREADIATGL
jgi:hypothetical protein